MLFYYLYYFRNESRFDLLELLFPQGLYSFIYWSYTSPKSRVKSILHTQLSVLNKEINTFLEFHEQSRPICFHIKSAKARVSGLIEGTRIPLRFSRRDDYDICFKKGVPLSTLFSISTLYPIFITHYLCKLAPFGMPLLFSQHFKDFVFLHQRFLTA